MSIDLSVLTPEQKYALNWRLAKEAEVRRTFWRCGVAECDGRPHEGVPVAHGRAGQMQPPGDWLEWLLMAGRGYGKTRAGAEWVRERANKGRFSRIALIGRTAADVRDVMIEGDSGLMSVYPKWQRPEYQPSKRRIVFHNGSRGFAYSSDEPDQLRGPQHACAWLDEPGSFKNLSAVLYNYRMGLRLGNDVRALLTTTPRVTAAMKALVKNPRVLVTHGTTYDNLANLAPAFRDLVVEQYEGTRVGRQEIDGILLDDIEGALWQWAMFEWDGFRPDLDELNEADTFVKTVVAIDPAVTSGAESDQSGLAVVAADAAKRAYVIHSEGVRLSPDAMLRRALHLRDLYSADLIVAETNNGGDYVEALLRTVPGGSRVPFKKVTAAKGKVTRAEPVVALYEQKRVMHVGHPQNHATLEDQQTTWTGMPLPVNERSEEWTSPDVMDAVVWGVTHLLVKATGRSVPQAKAVQT